MGILLLSRLCGVSSRVLQSQRTTTTNAKISLWPYPGHYRARGQGSSSICREGESSIGREGESSRNSQQVVAVVVAGGK